MCSKRGRAPNPALPTATLSAWPRPPADTSPAVGPVLGLGAGHRLVTRPIPLPRPSRGAPPGPVRTRGRERRIAPNSLLCGPGPSPGTPLAADAQSGSGVLSARRCFPPMAQCRLRGLAFVAGGPGPQGGRRTAGEARATRGPRRKARRCRTLPQAGVHKPIGAGGAAGAHARTFPAAGLPRPEAAE